MVEYFSRVDMNFWISKRKSLFSKLYFFPSFLYLFPKLFKIYFLFEVG